MLNRTLQGGQRADAGSNAEATSTPSEREGDGARTGALSILVFDRDALSRARSARTLARIHPFAQIDACASELRLREQLRGQCPDVLLLDVADLREFAPLSAEGSPSARRPALIALGTCKADAFDALEHCASAFVLRPVDEAGLAKAVAQAWGTSERTSEPETDAATPALPALRRIVVSDRGRLCVVPTAGIEYIRAAGKYATLHARGATHVIRHTLSGLEQRLDRQVFVRIHRSVIINVDFLAEMHPLFHGDFEVVMRCGTRLPMSRRFKHRLNPFLQI
jgi:two-component system, LytTR family, response regulator